MKTTKKNLKYQSPGINEVSRYEKLHTVTFENSKEGSVSIAREISILTRNKKIISVAGGGDTVAALSQSNYNKNFTYISTAGGAFLELLAGEKLPGLEVLRQ